MDNREIISMSFTEALDAIKKDIGIYELARTAFTSRRPLYLEREEGIFFKNLNNMLEDEVYINTQYDIYRYTVDGFVEFAREIIYDDNSTEIIRTFMVIEFDEEYHKVKSQADRDEKRMNDITDYLLSNGYTNGTVLRVPEENSNKMLMYLSSFLAGLETRDTASKLNELGSFVFIGKDI